MGSNNSSERNQSIAISLSTSTEIKQHQNEDGNQNTGLRCLAFSPNGTHLTAGDRQGNIRFEESFHRPFFLSFSLSNATSLDRVYNLDSLECEYFHEAHDAEVLSLSYYHNDEEQLLASAGRDRLIHIFDCNNQYSVIDTLDDHSSSITAVQWTRSSTDTSALRLVSSSADKSIVFRSVDRQEQQTRFKRLHQATAGSTVYDIDIQNTGVVFAAGKDKKVWQYVLETGKLSATHRLDQDSPTFDVLKVKLDPSSTIIAASCSDRSLRLYSASTGESLGRYYGHSEVITGVHFSLDGQFVVTVSGDGCIFVWQLSPEIAPKRSNNSYESVKASTVLQYQSPMVSRTKASTLKQYQIKSPGGNLIFGDDEHLPSWAKQLRHNNINNEDSNGLAHEEENEDPNARNRRYTIEPISKSNISNVVLCDEPSPPAPPIVVPPEVSALNANPDTSDCSESKVDPLPQPEALPQSEEFSSAKDFFTENFEALEFPEFAGTSSSSTRLSITKKFIKNLDYSEKEKSEELVALDTLDKDSHLDTTTLSGSQPIPTQPIEHDDNQRRKQRREDLAREVEKTRQRLAALGMHVTSGVSKATPTPPQQSQNKNIDQNKLHSTLSTPTTGNKRQTYTKSS